MADDDVHDVHVVVTRDHDVLVLVRFVYILS